MSSTPPPPYVIAGGKESKYVTLVDGAGNVTGGGGLGAANSGRISFEVTRGAGTTAYAVGAVVGGLFTLPNAAAIAAGTGFVDEVRLSTNNAVLTNANFRVWVFEVAPTVPADQAQFPLLYAALTPARFVGYTDLSLVTEGTGSDAATGMDAALRWPFVCAAGSQNLYAVVTARGAYVPAASQKFTLALGVERN